MTPARSVWIPAACIRWWSRIGRMPCILGPAPKPSEVLEKRSSPHIRNIGNGPSVCCVRRQQAFLNDAARLCTTRERHASAWPTALQDTPSWPVASLETLELLFSWVERSRPSSVAFRCDISHDGHCSSAISKTGVEVVFELPQYAKADEMWLHATMHPHKCVVKMIQKWDIYEYENWHALNFSSFYRSVTWQRHLWHCFIAIFIRLPPVFISVSFQSERSA